MVDVLRQYPLWHYTTGIKELGQVVKNVLGFLIHFFSIGLLLKTFFHPWRRMKEIYDGPLNLGAMASTLLINLIMRCVGIIARLAIITVGLVTVVVSALLGGVAFFVWLLLPFISVGCIIAGITLL